MVIKNLREEINKTHRPISISDDSDGNVNEFECKYCRRIIRSKFTEDSIWCNSCNAETIFDKDTKPVKKSLKAETLDSVEPAVVSLDYNLEEQVRIRKDPQLKGGFKVLRDRGLKITSYYDRNKPSEGSRFYCS